MLRLIAAALVGLTALTGCRLPEANALPSTRYDVAASPLTARVVAVGIPGAGAVSPVGVFHPGGPIADKPEFAAYLQSGRVLDPGRILVSSSSNFGAAAAQPEQAQGSILSLAPNGTDALIVPPDFAAVGDQGSILDGRVQLYTAQTADFLNSRYNPDASTAALPAVGNPRGISLNNAFGRPWFANAPLGSTGPGSVTVTDPDGRPLAGAPSKTAGGVFAGRHTNRMPASIPGALTGSVGTAFLGKAPDGSGRAVFAAVNADGSVVQVHVEKGVDGLAPEGTIAPLKDVGAQSSDSHGSVNRVGMVFNWVPDAIVYIPDPTRNSLVALTLTEDRQVFRLDGVRRITAPELSAPVDLAPAVPEVVSLLFSSNTTLAGRSDIYVANRGNGTIVRLSQQGAVLAVRQVEIPEHGLLGPGRLNGIAVSRDAQTIWVTVSGALDGFSGGEGAVVELPAFGGPKF